MENLPTETLTHIFKSLDPIALINVGSTNRRLRTIVFNNEKLQMRNVCLTVGSSNNWFYFTCVTYCYCTHHTREPHHMYCNRRRCIYHPMISKSFLALMLEVRGLVIEWHNDRVSVLRSTNLINRLSIKQPFTLTMCTKREYDEELQTLAEQMLASLKDILHCNCPRHSCNNMFNCKCSPLACPNVKHCRNYTIYNFHCDTEKLSNF